jgi:tetratricopeptide (TPR) repeat protein
MAIELEPLYFQAYYNRGYAYCWYYDEPAKALADFEMATKLRPTSATAHCELGNVRNHLGDPRGGLADTTRAIELDPEYACAYYTRGRIQNVLGRYAEAIADMSRYMELEPQGYRFTEALIERGYARAQSGDLERGVADFTAVIERDPNRAVAYYHRSALYELLGDRQAALDDLTIAVELYRQQGPIEEYNRAAEKLRQLTESTR